MIREIFRFFKVPIWKAWNEYHQTIKAINSNNYDLVFFFPFVHIGGAEIVHAEIVNTFPNKKKLVLISGISKNLKLLSTFANSSTVLIIPNATLHPLVKHKLIAQLLFSIEHTNPILMGSNSIFYYEILKRIKSHCKAYDLVHDFLPAKDGKTYIENKQSIERLDKRIFISKLAIDVVKRFYSENKFNLAQSQKIIFISNGVLIPDISKQKFKTPIQVLFVGRGSPEKRIEIVEQIARTFSKRDDLVFKIVGDVEDYWTDKNLSNVILLGEIADRIALNKLYQEAHFILCTSINEGFPMVLMEAMSFSVFPICTPVGDIPNRLNNKSISFITSSPEKEIVIEEITNFLNDVLNNPEKLEGIQEEAHQFARQNFNIENFRMSYRKLLGPDV